MTLAAPSAQPGCWSTEAGGSALSFPGGGSLGARRSPSKAGEDESEEELSLLAEAPPLVPRALRGPSRDPLRLPAAPKALGDTAFSGESNLGDPGWERDIGTSAGWGAPANVREAPLDNSRSFRDNTGRRKMGQLQHCRGAGLPSSRSLAASPFPASSSLGMNCPPKRCAS